MGLVIGAGALSVYTEKRVFCRRYITRVVCQARSLRQKGVYLYRVLCEVFDRVICQARSLR